MKPIIVDGAGRPWWRHSIFPWGWMLLAEAPINNCQVDVSGYYKPGDVPMCSYSFSADGALVATYPNGEVKRIEIIWNI